MKIRKALAVVLSLAMTVTLMPATAFASTAKVSKVLTVEDGTVANAVVRITLDDKLLPGADNKQTITLDVTQNGEFAKIGGGYTLKGADDPTDTDGASVVVDALKDSGADLAVPVKTAEGANFNVQNDGEANTIYVKATDASKKSIDFELESKGLTLNKDAIILLYVNVEADGSDGDEVQVSLDGDGVIESFSAKTIATINGGGTDATVEDADTVGRGTKIGAAEVTLKETTDKAVTATKANPDEEAAAITPTVPRTQTVKLTLPKGVTWSWSNADRANTNQTNTTTVTGNMIGTWTSGALSNDDRTLTIKFVAKGNPDTKEKLIINPVINVGKDANKGDIKLKVEVDDKDTQISEESGLVIAKYGDVNVSIFSKDAENLPEVVAGKLADKDNDNFVVSVTLEENSKDALTSGKYVDFAFNTDSVQVLATSEIKYYVGSKYAKKEYDDGDSAAAIVDITASNVEADVAELIKKDRSEFTLTVPNDGGDWKANEANTLTLFIPVTVSADYTGDITLTAKGNAGIDETTVTVAKAVAPVTVTTSVTNVVNGAQAQATADVTITENFAGALKDNKYVNLKINELGLGGVVFKNDGTAKVTAGDLEIKDSEKNATINDEKQGTNVISIKVDDESTEASTITVSGLAINLARILPEGEYDLQVGGSALVENAKYNDGDFSANAVKGKYINITTAADTAQSGIVATFSLDGTNNSTYTVNGATATMDAAAYLDSNNRTMVPIRYVGYALGLTDTDISYNVGDSTATLSGLTNVVKVTTGSNVLQCSNGNVTMDTVAVNNSGRLYVPARFISQAMGAQVAWDQATKTVTITK